MREKVIDYIPKITYARGEAEEGGFGYLVHHMYYLINPMLCTFTLLLLIS